MWQLHYVRAQELALEREREAARVRLAHLHAAGRPSSGLRFARIRRGGAVTAAWIARHLDERAAHDALVSRAVTGGSVGLPG
jgi:hypothetical protein